MWIIFLIPQCGQIFWPHWFSISQCGQIFWPHWFSITVHPSHSNTYFLKVGKWWVFLQGTVSRALLTKSFYQHNVNALTLARTHRECSLQSSKLEGQYTPPGLRPVGAYCPSNFSDFRPHSLMRPPQSQRILSVRDVLSHHAQHSLLAHIKTNHRRDSAEHYFWTMKCFYKKKYIFLKSIDIFGNFVQW